MRCSIVSAAAGLLLGLIAFRAEAQTFQLGLNAADLARLGTLNAEAGVAVQRHWTLGAKARINPWSFTSADSEERFQSKRQTWWTGVRYWPWHVYSGWWTSSGVQYSEFNEGGIQSPLTREGDAWGVSLSAGYSLMLADHLNIEFGFGFWGGYQIYTVYSCPVCGKVVDSGNKLFLLPNEALLSLMYVF